MIEGSVEAVQSSDGVVEIEFTSAKSSILLRGYQVDFPIPSFLYSLQGICIQGLHLRERFNKRLDDRGTSSEDSWTSCNSYCLPACLPPALSLAIQSTAAELEGGVLDYLGYLDIMLGVNAS